MHFPTSRFYSVLRTPTSFYITVTVCAPNMGPDTVTIVVQN